MYYRYLARYVLWVVRVGGDDGQLRPWPNMCAESIERVSGTSPLILARHPPYGSPRGVGVSYERGTPKDLPGETVLAIKLCWSPL